MEPPITLKGVVGIQNMGNTCYVNAVLQLLRTCHAWNGFCLTTEFDPSKKITLAYKDMLVTMWSAYKPAYVRPLAFIADIKKAVENTPYVMFGQPMQHDAHEYLAYLMDQFHEELKTESVVPDGMMNAADRAWYTFLSKQTSEMVRIFFGMLRKTVICSNCQNKTYQWELFNTLKIPCEGATFNDWIQKEVNEVSEIDAYKCDTCNGKYPAKKYSHVWKAPEHLFIVIHRFRGDGSKHMEMCPIVEQLTLEPYYAEEAPRNHITYQLSGIVDHHGGHIHGGHYTSQFKHPISNEWWFFDDERAGQLESPQGSSANYIFSYRIG
jgi:ubiquitin carboxyl-terminal hydrolase 2/21/ubiquitin carboxyl-terminal hydrolase 8